MERPIRYRSHDDPDDDRETPDDADGAAPDAAPDADAREDDDDAEDGDEDDGALDEEFPLGDGTADTQVVVRCPYCGEWNELALDPGSGTVQEYVEDCTVCCRPWLVTVTFDRLGRADVELARE